MQLTIVKIGGNIIDDPAKLDAFLQLFAAVAGSKILVHGGGKIATDIGLKLGIVPNYVEGRRITDEETLKLVTMVYAGLINKNMVAALQNKNCNAIGLTGADGGILPATKRPVKDVDYGYVGDVTNEQIKSSLVCSLLAADLVPVFAPLTYDGNGGMLNTNADTIAQELAKAMAKAADVTLVYCFEKNGVLSDAHDDNSVIHEVTTDRFVALKEQGIVSGGMLPKLQNAFEAIQQGVKQVMIGHANDLHALIEGRSGTRIH